MDDFDAGKTAGRGSDGLDVSDFDLFKAWGIGIALEVSGTGEGGSFEAFGEGDPWAVQGGGGFDDHVDVIAGGVSGQGEGEAGVIFVGFEGSGGLLGGIWLGGLELEGIFFEEGEAVMVGIGQVRHGGGAELL